ncbi:MAG: S8 family peptidase [Bdellovibrionota bacterium]
MKSFGFPLIISGFVILFMGSLTGYYVLEGQLEEGSVTEFASRSESSTKASLSAEDRKLEDSKITTKVDKVPDEPSALFNDPAINQAWGLKKTDAARAWSVSQGSRSIVVAVIDTGIDIKHEDLKENLWLNAGETGNDSKGKDKSKNGVDDDNDGFVDNVYGWNFVSNNHDLTDNHGHGTHIAGIIGAVAGNNKGISGIAPHVSLMILKYYDPKVPNTDNLKNTIKAFRYAVAHGANIINYSGGGLEFSQDEHDAVKEAQERGILVVAAAGNERSNSDVHHYYPADYKLSNIISVTAFDPTVEVLPSSNWGTETVDIAAPGQNILSTLPNNAYGYMTGTSQATAFVSGAAALVMAHRQFFKADDVKKYVLSTGDAMSSLSAKTRTSRKLNLYKSLTILDSGVSATGVMAENGDGEQSFTSDPKAALKATGKSNINSFGKSLMDAVKAPPQKQRLANDPKEKGL